METVLEALGGMIWRRSSELARMYLTLALSQLQRGSGQLRMQIELQVSCQLDRRFRLWLKVIWGKAVGPPFLFWECPPSLEEPLPQRENDRCYYRGDLVYHSSNSLHYM